MGLRTEPRDVSAESAAPNEKLRMRHVLPASLPPRGLSRVEAAQYIGVSPSLFGEMVKDGRMPPPKPINTRKVWDRLRLDQAFEALPDIEGAAENPWDEVTHGRAP
jgi:predicted DNA-binding transcriptional regulator AlpA